MIVESIIKVKGSGVFTIGFGCQLAETAKLLSQKRIGAVIVTKADGSICGVLSERDIVNAIAKEGASVLMKPVGEFMSGNVITCSLHDTINHCMTLMTDRRFRHLPVVEDGQLKGIISIGDVVKHRISETEHEAEALRDYIATG